jgi:hypothetical protein
VDVEWETHLAAASTLFLTLGTAAHAAPIVINNGLAPPNPENVIDAADDYSGDEVCVARCPAGVLNESVALTR